MDIHFILSSLCSLNIVNKWLRNKRKKFIEMMLFPSKTSLFLVIYVFKNQDIIEYTKLANTILKEQKERSLKYGCYLYFPAKNSIHSVNMLRIN